MMDSTLILAMAALAVALGAIWFTRRWLRRQHDSRSAYLRLLQVLLWLGGAGVLTIVGVCVFFPSLRPTPPVAILLGIMIVYMGFRVRMLIRKTAKLDP